MKHFLFILALLFCVFSLEAQQGINYQIVVRDASGDILSSKSVDFDVKIFDGNKAVFTENHSISSSAHGVCQFIIGSKDSVAFHKIDWSRDLIIDIEAFNSGVSLGKSNSGFQYVPYGLYSEKAGSVDSVYYGDVKFGNANLAWVSVDDTTKWNQISKLQNSVSYWNDKLDEAKFDTLEASRFVEGDKERYDLKSNSLDSMLMIAQKTVWVDSAKATGWSVKLDSNVFSDLETVRKISSNDVQSWNDKATTASVDAKVDKGSFAELDAVTSIDSSKITEWDNKVTKSELNQKVDKISIGDLLTIGKIDSTDVNIWNSKVDSSSFTDLSAIGSIKENDIANWNKTYDSVLVEISGALLKEEERKNWNGKLDSSLFMSLEASKFVTGDKDSLGWVIQKVKEIDNEPSIILQSDIDRWDGKLDSVSFFNKEASKFTHGDKKSYDSLNLVSKNTFWVDSTQADDWNQKLDKTDFTTHEASLFQNGDKAKLDKTEIDIHSIQAQLSGKILVTKADSINWSNKVDSSSFNDLPAIGAIYQSDIDQWNNKLDSSFTHISFQLDSNDVKKIRNLVAADTIQDSVITAEDIAYWNAKVDKVAFTDLNAVGGITSAKITTWNNNVTKVTNLENDVYTAGVGSDVKWKNKLDASIYNNSEAKKFKNGDKVALDELVSDTIYWNNKLDKAVYDAAPASGIKATDITKWNTDDTQILSPNSNSKVEVSNNNAVIFTNGVERFRIQADGDVGIGMNNPTQKLEVNGNVKTNKVIAENGIQFADNTTLTSANLVGLNLTAADTARWANHMDSSSFPYLANNRKITNADLNTWNAYDQQIKDNNLLISTNTASIEKNATNIAKNASSIMANSTSISSLQTNKLNTTTFDNSVAGKIKQADVNTWNGYQSTINIANQGEDSISNVIGTSSIKTSVSDVVSIKTNDVERITVLKTGQVGIGSTNPSYKLTVAGSVNGDWFFMDNGIQFTGTTTKLTLADVNSWNAYKQLIADNTKAIVDNKVWNISGTNISNTSNNIGIGTTAPVSKLQVNATVNQAAITVNRTNTSSIEGGANWLILDGNRTTNGKLGLNFYSTGDVILARLGGKVGVGTNTPVTNMNIHTEDKGEMYLKLSNGDTKNTVLDGFDIGLTDNDDAILNMRENKDIYFRTNNVDRFFIQNNGFIGINKSNPNAMLDIRVSGGNGVFVENAEWNQFDGSFLVKHAGSPVNEGDGFYIQNDGGEKSTWGFHVNNSEGPMILGYGNNGGGADPIKDIEEKFVFKADGSVELRTDSDGKVIKFGISGESEKFGGIRTNGGGKTPSFYSSSDIRIKKNIAPAATILDKIMSLEIVEYDFINGGHADYGVVAQQLNEVFPSKVTKTDDGVSALTDSSKIWTVAVNYQYELLKATQEQQIIIENQSKEIELLKTKLEDSIKEEETQKAENASQQSIIDSQQQQLQSLEYQLEEIRRHLGMDAKAKLD